MTERSFPFDGGLSTLTDEDWSQLARTWQDDGVIVDNHGSNALTVTNGFAPDEVLLVAGRANVRGFHYVLDTDMGLPISLNTSTTQARYDLVVLRHDLNLNKVYAVVKQGTPGSPEPTATKNDTIYEIPLTRLTLPPNQGAVSTFADRRTFTGRRIQITDNGWYLAPGNIYYQPVSGKFYMNDSVGNGQPIARLSDTRVHFCTSTTRPTDLADGQLIYETDTTNMLVFRFGAFQPINGKPPMAVLRHSIEQGASANVSAILAWDLEDVDNVGGHTTIGSANSKYTVQRAGWYRVSINASCSPVSGGYRQLAVRKNSNMNGNIIAQAFPTSSTVVPLSASGLMKCNVGDYLDVEFFHTGSGVCNVYGGATSRFEIEWISA
ncbi:hypothetical protein [Nonomuraea recticatena]|uniref:Uncharacterized protein n=1 Tax=Nonomuraea recticatena TaxID=46178 RepID=A0ABN3S123_9ACTN